MTGPCNPPRGQPLPRAALLQIAFRNVRRQLRHSAFALAAIAFGVAGLALADGFIRDVFFQLGEATARAELGHIQITRPGFRNGGAGRPEEYVIERPEAIRALLAGDPARRIGGRETGGFGLLSAAGREFSVLIEGIEPTPVSSAGAYLQLLSGRDSLQRARRAGPAGGRAGKPASGLPRGDAVLMASTIDWRNEQHRPERGRRLSKPPGLRRPGAAAPRGDAGTAADRRANALIVHLHQTDQTDAVWKAFAGIRRRPAWRSRPGNLSCRTLPPAPGALCAPVRHPVGDRPGVLIAMSVLTSFNITVFERTASSGR